MNGDSIHGKMTHPDLRNKLPAYRISLEIARVFDG
jgi:hypothetical protein